MTDDAAAPRIIDPGATGWAPEPKVTQAELLLYGEYAGAVRMLGQGAAALQDGYSLVCRQLADLPVADIDELSRSMINAAYSAYSTAVNVHRAIAHDVLGRIRARALQFGEANAAIPRDSAENTFDRQEQDARDREEGMMTSRR